MYIPPTFSTLGSLLGKVDKREREPKHMVVLVGHRKQVLVLVRSISVQSVPWSSQFTQL